MSKFGRDVYGGGRVGTESGRGGAKMGGAEAGTEKVVEHLKLLDRVTVGLFISVSPSLDSDYCSWLAVCSVSK